MQKSKKIEGGIFYGRNYYTGQKRDLQRDSVATISKMDKRNFINPKKPKGKLYNLRTVFSIFYLIIFFTFHL